MSKKQTRFRRTPEEIEQGLTVEQAKAARKANYQKKEQPEVLRAPKPEGLGDKVKKVLKSTGVKAFVEFLNGGKECEGCQKRKEALNKITKHRKAKNLELSDIEFIVKIKDKNTLKATEVMYLYMMHARIYNYKYIVPGNCASCVIQRRNDLVELYNLYHESK